jgi:hypothetical protein
MVRWGVSVKDSSSEFNFKLNFMKKFILLLSIFLSLNVNSQNTIAFDNMETYDWSGLWFGNSYNSTWATNFSVSPQKVLLYMGLVVEILQLNKIGMFYQILRD